MNPDLPEVAADFGAAAAKAFAALGGVDCARRAEADPDVRRREVASALDSLGAAELDPRADLETAASAGELCRAAGRCVLPYPVVSVLMGFAVAGTDRIRVDHGDLFGEWRVAALDGTVKGAAPATPRLGSKLGPFVTDLTPTGDVGPSIGASEVSLWLTLGAWRIVGVVERAVELAVEHVTGRVQFGQQLSKFQAVQFQLADASVAVDGLRELCRYTLCSGALADSLALRLHALDVARAVLRTTQQLHGASGLCDEYDISILCRHVQPDLRLPAGAEQTAADLFNAVVASGFPSLFPHGGGTG